MEFKKVKIGDQEVDFATNILEEELETNESIDELEDTMDFSNHVIVEEKNND